MIAADAANGGGGGWRGGSGDGGCGGGVVVAAVVWLSVSVEVVVEGFAGYPCLKGQK